MLCPKCEIGRIKKIVFKNSGKNGFLCDYCEILWYENEEINMGTGRPFEVESSKNDLEFVLEESEEKDQEHRDAKYSLAK